MAGHKGELEGPLFRPVRNRVTGELNKSLHPGLVYQDIVKRYGTEVGITADVRGFCVHSLRATAATNALAYGADIAKVQEWLGHADISTTRMYDRRRWHPEENPTFKKGLPSPGRGSGDSAGRGHDGRPCGRVSKTESGRES